MSHLGMELKSITQKRQIYFLDSHILEFSFEEKSHSSGKWLQIPVANYYRPSFSCKKYQSLGYSA